MMTTDTMTFDIWAPAASTLTLLLDGERHGMTATTGGWWTAPEGLSGTDYGYLVDDDEMPLPDPRSRRQPGSVHGLSRTFNSEFEWSDSSWTGRQLAGGVIYELHLGTFTLDGTLDSAIDKLDHLVSIGVDFVELLPVNGFNGDHNWGYDGVLWYTVDETYGGPAAYERFVDAAHARGLGVIQDVVYNHLGPSGNYLPRFGPYLRSGSSNTWGDSINLDELAVRSYIVDNALGWFRDFHIDGLRLDAVHALVDDSPKHILQELSEETDALSAALRRPLTLIAESDLNDPKLITPREGGSGGYGLQAQWSDDFHHAVHVALTGETSGYYADFARLDSLAKVMTRGFFHDGTYSSFRERDHGHPIDVQNMPSWRLVVANQNHDQVGNRAVGDRLSAQLDADQLAIAAVLTLAGPFTPMLFMGEEWGASTPWQFFTAHPELGTATAEGRIAEFAKMGWDPAVVPDPQDAETFERSKLDWDEPADGDHARLLQLYRSLAALRRDRPDLTDPRMTRLSTEFDDDAKWFALHRAGPAGSSTSVVVNFADFPVALSYGGTLLLATTRSVAASSSELLLGARSAAIIAR
jgi:maltooligosyltrehalose trehalohydrolase